MTTHKKMKINKKIKAQKRKMEKQYKKNKKLGTIPIRRKAKKDEVPNSYPFKQEYLEKLAHEQEQKKLENQQKALQNSNTNKPKE